MQVSLDDVDELRRRTGASYRQAVEALKRNEGDVVPALTELEGEMDEKKRFETFHEKMTVKGERVVEKLAELIRQGNVTSITVIKDGRTVFEAPVTLGVVGAVAFPSLTAAGLMAAVATDCTIVVERRLETGGGPAAKKGGNDSRQIEIDR